MDRAAGRALHALQATRLHEQAGARTKPAAPRLRGSRATGVATAARRALLAARAGDLLHLFLSLEQDHAGGFLHLIAVQREPEDVLTRPATVKPQVAGVVAGGEGGPRIVVGPIRR